MTTEPITTVEAFVDGFAAMDFDAALDLLAEDCKYTNVPLMTVTGRGGVRDVPVWRDDFDLATIHGPNA